mmetsp:Transcript_35829/g.67533  ORF Transcript_35829/g.67533 Transcript_35829/m.67533 type:complete len:398 (+) Transcript_35829:2545-3738(+)
MIPLVEAISRILPSPPTRRSVCGEPSCCRKSWLARALEGRPHPSAPARLPARSAAWQACSAANPGWSPGPGWVRHWGCARATALQKLLPLLATARAESLALESYAAALPSACATRRASPPTCPAGRWSWSKGSGRCPTAARPRDCPRSCGALARRTRSPTSPARSAAWTPCGRGPACPAWSGAGGGLAGQWRWVEAYERASGPWTWAWTVLSRSAGPPPSPPPFGSCTRPHKPARRCRRQSPPARRWPPAQIQAPQRGSTLCARAGSSSVVSCTWLLRSGSRRTPHKIPARRRPELATGGSRRESTKVSTRRRSPTDPARWRRCCCRSGTACTPRTAPAPAAGAGRGWLPETLGKASGRTPAPPPPSAPAAPPPSKVHPGTEPASWCCRRSSSGGQT